MYRHTITIYRNRPRNLRRRRSCGSTDRGKKSGDSAGPPYALDGFVVPSDSGYSTAANIGRVGFPLIVFALVVAGAGISLLKGHWWMGLLGALGFGVYALWSTQVSLDIALLGRFEEDVENNIGLAIFIASSAGALLLLLGAVLPARSGSWWDRNRTTEPVSGQTHAPASPGEEDRTCLDLP